MLATVVEEAFFEVAERSAEAIPLAFSYGFLSVLVVGLVVACLGLTASILRRRAALAATAAGALAFLAGELKVAAFGYFGTGTLATWARFFPHYSLVAAAFVFGAAAHRLVFAPAAAAASDRAEPDGAQRGSASADALAGAALGAFSLLVTAALFPYEFPILIELGTQARGGQPVAALAGAHAAGQAAALLLTAVVASSLALLGRRWPKVLEHVEIASAAIAFVVAAALVVGS